MSALFGELVTAMITPFNEDGTLNLEKAAELATYLADSGSDAIVVSGTTGESPTLTEDEKNELFKIVADAVKGKAKVIAGTGSNDTSQSIRLTKSAEKYGADGIMLVVPYYNKPPQEGLYQHFSKIAASTNLPVMLYNVPGRTGTNMSVETTLRLAALDNVIAVKEASGDLEQIARIRTDSPDGFSIYSGDDALILPILAVGGTGVVSVAAHIAGKEIKEMIQLFKNGDNESALRVHLRLLPLLKVLFITSNPIPVKSAMNMMGHDVGPLRLPLISMKEKEHEAVRTVLTSLGYLG